MGGTSSGRVSGVTAQSENPFAALYNPSLIATQTTGLFSFSTYQARAQYAPIKDSPLKSTNLTLWTLGFTYPFTLAPVANRQAGLGITLSGPYNKIRSFISHTSDELYPLRYGSSDSQFKGTFSGSVELLPEHLFFGAGVSFFLTGAGNAEATVTQNNPSGRMALDVGLSSALVTGLTGRVENTTLAATYHQALDPDFVQSFDGKADIAGSMFHQPLLVKSSLYFEPHTLEIEAEQDFKTFKASLGVSYQVWSGFKPPILIVETKDSDGKTHTTQLPVTSYRNTLNPRVSIEVPTFEKKLLFSTGYQYRPTPVADARASGNALDSNTHIAGISIEYQFQTSEVLPWPARLGLFGQYHWLNERQVAKTLGEGPLTTGYTFSGNAYTYGLSLSVGL